MTSATTIVLILYVVQGLLGLALSQSAIVGIERGHQVDIEDAPFMAGLYVLEMTIPTQFLCGGSIIHKQFVLTTAHCIDDDPLIVRVGSPYTGEGGTLHGVDKYIKHELYSDKTYDNDVALLKLSEPVTIGSSVATIKLADESIDIPTGLTANVTGWGFTENIWNPSELQQALVLVSPPDNCAKLTDKQICIEDLGSNTDAYDEGGPLTSGDLQIGIISVDFSNQRLKRYLKVAPYKQWIRNKIIQNL